jgi:hypothetical protein
VPTGNQTHDHPNLIHTIKFLYTVVTTTFVDGNPVPGLGLAQKGIGSKLKNGITSLTLLIIGSTMTIQIYKHTKRCLLRFPSTNVVVFFFHNHLKRDVVVCFVDISGFYFHHF